MNIVLGANEAPPAIISVFLGEQLTDVLDMIEKGAKEKVSKKDIIDLGVARLPRFNKDSTDRNRTSHLLLPEQSLNSGL